MRCCVMDSSEEEVEVEEVEVEHQRERQSHHWDVLLLVQEETVKTKQLSVSV